MTKVPSPQTAPSNLPEDAVAVGLVRGGWGVQGDVKVDPLTDVPGRFSLGSLLYLGDQPATIERVRSLKGGLLVKFDVVSDRTHADSLHGVTIGIPRDQIEPLPDTSYYHFQIIDMEVWTEDGDYLGVVKEILTTPSNDVYVVGDGSRQEVLVPALKDVVLEVEPDENRMVVRLPEGLR